MTDKAIVAQQRKGIVNKLAETYDMEAAAFQQTLVSTVFPGGKSAKPEHVAALCIVAHEYGLNPLTKQIYAFPEKGGGIIPVISVDGWYAIANRQPHFDGIQFEYIDDEKGNVVACKATVYRTDRAHPTSVTEYVAECKRNSPPWNNQPRRMIRHRAAIQAIRIAFGISAIDPDEAERIPEYYEVASKPPAEAVADINATVSEGMTEVVPEGSEGPESVPSSPDVPPEPEPSPEPEDNQQAVFEL